MAHTPGFEPQSDQPTPNGQDPHVLSGSAYGRTTNVPTLGDLVSNIKVDGVRMLNDNVALAKAEVQPMAKHGGIGAGMFGGAGYFALCGLALLFMAGGFGFSQMWQSIVSGFGVLTALALGFVTMGIVLFLLAGILGLIGKSEVGKIKKPEATIEEAKNTVAALQQSLKRGQQTVKVNTLDRAGLAQDKKAMANLDKAAEQAHRLADDVN